jgi:hypothetical protein
MRSGEGQLTEDFDAWAIWRWIEPIHAVTYFAPECCAAALPSFWMGYFGARASPVGPVVPIVSWVDPTIPSRHCGRRVLPSASTAATATLPC